MNRRVKLWLLGIMAMLATIGFSMSTPQVQCWFSLNPTRCAITTDLPKMYAALEKQLKQQQWQAADQTTYQLLVQTARLAPQAPPSFPSSKQPGSEDLGWLTPNLMVRIPCPDLQKIDQLWTQNSQGRFGLTVQQQIRAEIFKHPILDPGKALAIRLGWLKPDGSTLEYAKYSFSLEAPSGQFPTFTQHRQLRPGVTTTIQLNPAFLFNRSKHCLAPTAVATTSPSPSQVSPPLDYSYLENVLDSQEWFLASLATDRILEMALNSERTLDAAALAQIPCPVLSHINQLWSKASQGRFGLKPQQQVWEKVRIPGAPLSTTGKFRGAMGWDQNYPYDTPLSQVEFGLFPRLQYTTDEFFQRVKACSL